MSKVLTVIITLLVSFIIIILCLVIVFLNKDTWLFLKSTLEQSAIFFDSSVFGLISTMAILIFFQFLYIMMSGMLGIIIGHKSTNLKIVKSIIYGFILYMGLSIMSIGIIYIIGLIDSNILSIFNSISVSSSVLKNLMIIIIIVYMIYNISLYFISNKLLNKGVNVD